MLLEGGGHVAVKPEKLRPLEARPRGAEAEVCGLLAACGSEHFLVLCSQLPRARGAAGEAKRDIEGTPG